MCSCRQAQGLVINNVSFTNTAWSSFSWAVLCFESSISIVDKNPWCPRFLLLCVGPLAWCRLPTPPRFPMCRPPPDEFSFLCRSVWHEPAERLGGEAAGVLVGDRWDLRVHRAVHRRHRSLVSTLEPPVEEATLH